MSSIRGLVGGVFLLALLSPELLHATECCTNYGEQQVCAFRIALAGAPDSVVCAKRRIVQGAPASMRVIVRDPRLRMKGFPLDVQQVEVAAKKAVASWSSAFRNATGAPGPRDAVERSEQKDVLEGESADGTIVIEWLLPEEVAQWKEARHLIGAGPGDAKRHDGNGLAWFEWLQPDTDRPWIRGGTIAVSLEPSDRLKDRVGVVVTRSVAWHPHTTDLSTLPTGNPVCFQDVLLHELGHTLGLGNTEVPHAVMNESIRREGLQPDFPTEVDRVGLAMLYRRR